MRPPEPRERDRLHGFDAVRGLAAVAVVALHAAYAYALFPLPGLVWPVPLDEPSRLADAAFWWIEGSVMPLFFTLSGYFLARSLARQSPGKVFAGRTRRLLLPVATVGFGVLAVDLHVWVLGLISTDRATVTHYREMKFPPAIQADLFGPAHLWYVEYLWVLCAVVCGVVWVGRAASVSLPLRGRVGVGANGQTAPALACPHPSPPPKGEGTNSAACVFAALAACAALVLSLHPEVVLGFQHGWLPHPAKLAHAAVFLLFGVLLCRTGGLVEWTRRLAPLLLVAAAGTFTFLLPRIHEAMLASRAAEADPLLGVLLAAFAISATFGHIGAGLRWLDRPSPILARLAAASFWIYLAHHPLMGLFQIMLRPAPVPPIAKFAVVFGGTLVACLVSYRWFVENGVVGRLLDGEWPWRAFRRPEPAVLPLPEPSPAQRAA